MVRKKRRTGHPPRVLWGVAILLILMFSLTVFAAGKVTDVEGEKVRSGFDNFLKIMINDSEGFVDGITQISINDTDWEEVSTTISLFGSGKYYLDKEANEIYFDGTGSGVLKTGDRICIQSSDYDELVLNIIGEGDSFGVEIVESSPDPDPEPSPDPVPDPTPDKKEAPELTAAKKSQGLYDFLALSVKDAEGYVDGITQISINDKDWEEVSATISLYGSGKYYLNKETNEIYFDGSGSGVFDVGDKICIYNPNYETLVLEVTGTGDSFNIGNAGSESDPTPEPDPTPGGDTTPAPSVYAEMGTGFNAYRNIVIISDSTDYISNITEIQVNDGSWTAVSSKAAVFGSGTYYLGKEENKLYFDGSKNVFDVGDRITIKSEGYEDLILSVTEEAFKVEPYDPEKPVDKDILHIRLVGYFEAALQGQKKYDAISGASTSVSANQNSNVTVQAVILPDGTEPEEDDWKDLNSDSDIRINSDKSKSYVSISPEGSGMVGVYSPYDGSITLAGTPEGVGEYMVSVTFTDEDGHTATSNELIFKIYKGNEKLIDQLTLGNSEQTADGKYMYDMEPWAIKDFGGTDETVTVPADIKAWYGSHTSGTYGELGYAVSGAPVQTLIVPEGCNLTLVNMKILSSVKIVVENGGKLVLRDSSVHGQIVVNDGGSFSMNYDDYNEEFLTGASINGQLILNDGATLENSSIYSNTNFLGNGSEVRHNTEPVVLVNGSVNVNGSVFIRGDESATGTDPATGKSYSGQPALKVENGTLNIPEGSVVAAYGGGHLATTSVGGEAVILDNGTITGEGRLIALGGYGDGDDGGDAVSGTGTVSVRDAYLEGGSVFLPKNASITAGKSHGDNVMIAGTTNRNLIDGQRLEHGGDISERYWSDITMIPDLSLYTVEQNAPGDDQPSDVPVAGVTLNKNTLKLIGAGSSETLTAAVVPENASDKEVIWSSDNESVATVDENGKVTAVSGGTAVITVTTRDGDHKASCTVSVTVTDVVHVHELKEVLYRAATCTETGNKAYYICITCGTWFADKDMTTVIADHDYVVIPAVGHKMQTNASGEQICSVCGYKLTPPKIIKGMDAIWEMAIESSLTFVSDAVYADFISVSVDGKVINSSYYTVSEGSTIVTLKSFYLSGLAEGSHTLTISSANGDASTKFTVVKKVNSNTDKTNSSNHKGSKSGGSTVTEAAETSAQTSVASAGTGDQNNILLWFFLLTAAALGIAAIAVYKKK